VPGSPRGRLVFELLEQLRVETLAPDQHAGVIANLRHRFTAWSHAFYDSGLAEGASGCCYTVFQMCWSRLTAAPCWKRRKISSRRRAGPSPRNWAATWRACAATWARPPLPATRWPSRHAVDAMLQEAQAAGAARTTGDAKAQAAFRLLLDFDSDNDNNAAPLGEAALTDGDGGYRRMPRHMTAKKKRANWYAAPCCSKPRAHG
jgi:cobaltochelatase CobT